MRWATSVTSSRTPLPRVDAGHPGVSGGGPVPHRGSTPSTPFARLYVCIDNGVLSAYEAATGRRLYQTRLARDSVGFSASPVAADGRLYFPSGDGMVYVVRAGREFELLARNDMREMCLASPALIGDLLLLRTRTRLYALRQEGAASGE